MEISNLQAMAEKHGIQTIVIPGWDTEPFVCRVKRPTLYNMASTGLVPNPLLNVVQEMFVANPKSLERITIDKQAQALIQMAKYALVEPTYDEITASGLTLTDDQLLTLYAFAIGGASALEPFREKLLTGSDGNEPDVRRKTKRNSGDK